LNFKKKAKIIEILEKTEKNLKAQGEDLGEQNEIVKNGSIPRSGGKGSVTNFFCSGSS
jgi:hypothetical protein